MCKEEGDKRSKNNPWQQQKRSYQDKDEDMKLWGIVVFGLIGATVTTLAVTQLRRTVDWISIQVSSSRAAWKKGTSFRSSFQEEAWKKYNRRMQEEYEEEMERVERIRRMQSVFNRERNKYRRGYESWQEQGSSAYHQHFQRNDWYWKADTSHRDHQHSNFRETPRPSTNVSLSHHYSVLGLDRRRTKPYTDDEIKSAFRTKAKEFHPDQNQEKKNMLKQSLRKLWFLMRPSSQKEKAMAPIGDFDSAYYCFPLQNSSRTAFTTSVPSELLDLLISLLGSDDQEFG